MGVCLCEGIHVESRGDVSVKDKSMCYGCVTITTSILDLTCVLTFMLMITAETIQLVSYCAVIFPLTESLKPLLWLPFSSSSVLQPPQPPEGS